MLALTEPLNREIVPRSRTFLISNETVSREVLVAMEFNCVLAAGQLVEIVPHDDGQQVVGVVELLAGGPWFLLLFQSRLQWRRLTHASKHKWKNANGMRANCTMSFSRVQDIILDEEIG